MQKISERFTAPVRRPAHSGLLFGFFFLASWGMLFVPVSADESPKQVGYFCSPDTTSIVSEQYYQPQSDPCTYLAAGIEGFKVGDLYRGVVGSSTRIIGHALSRNESSDQYGDVSNALSLGVHAGDDMFVTIYEERPFSNDAADFRSFFARGGQPPHQNYGFIRFKYGTPPPPEPETPDPVIIIPGILGSEQHNGEWIIDPILHTYDDLIATLDVNGYTPDVDLFTFPYNWRKSNVETAVLLKQKIDEVKAICNCDKVDLVAHSMGGLVARQYIQSVDYDQDVDQLIFLGTPHLGSPDAYLMWEAGEVGPFGNFREAVMERILKQEAKEKGYTDLLSYIHTAPISSVSELLPTYDYIFDDAQLRNYPNNYPVNTFLEALNADVLELTTSGVVVTNIVGNTLEQNTITGIQSTDPTNYLPKWSHGYPQNYSFPIGNHGLLRGSGDGTVPLPSASFINSNLTVSTSTHRSIPANQEGDVFAILTGQPAVELVHNSQTDFKLILIKALSPIDLLVVDPDGKKIGKDFATGQEINEIPNAFYTGFTTNTEYITILNPLDGEYKILNQGTGSGSYTLETNYMSDATTTEASFTGNTLLGLITELKVPIDNVNPAELEIQPTDITPPDITIHSPTAKDYLRSEQLPINVSATDSESGVHELVSLLDSTSTPNVGSIDLFFQPLGAHSVFTSSTDNVGNKAMSTRAFRVIADATSTLSDIDRAYSLGWQTKKVHDDLAKKLKACNVKKTTVTNVTKTIVVTGKNGKITTKKVQEKVTKVEIVFDKNCAKAMLKEFDKYRNKGLNEQAYQLLKEDINWIINN
ncbi:hypothetical protein A2765_02795 [Candidatus Kaiserbacteria bacterium RIFCSPHIGHO2_01_FULL_56_24]|uniref:PGAP1 family protein n=1 Tax=Candidatus Kaiserbacteria bacterium RIFCSPHIGHO2_01_FULL_56_24 TaxID=1798487 RepID=A0A1F6DB40_9BACT|nr:MAG: hypothetical protein A2765_02795 [Candidatus Kaiserbacteria bacterium RIFCSPHIGHO2_01_FULL_56_24]